MHNGVRRAPVNKQNALEVWGEIVERVDLVFFSDPTTAAMKPLVLAWPLSEGDS
jgi:ATP-dependent Lon protease